MAKISIKRHATPEAARDQYTAKVDEHAEMVRCRYITKGDGQAMAYEAKRQEACRYPGDGPFPWLEGEAEALGTTPQVVAESIIAARAEWETAGIAIEQARLKAKTEIRAAGTAAEMHATLDRLRAALPPPGE